MDEGILGRLRDISLFQDLRDDPAAMERLIGICRTKSYADGTQIIREGDGGSKMFIVLSGEVEIKKRTMAGDAYTVALLKAEQNVFFGELALVAEDEARSATVVTRADSVFIEIEKKDFLSFGDENPQLGLAITRVLARIIASRLRKTTVDMLTIFDALVSEIST